jgi:hypothetical protein
MVCEFIGSVDWDNNKEVQKQDIEDRYGENTWASDDVWEQF